MENWDKLTQKIEEVCKQTQILRNFFNKNTLQKQQHILQAFDTLNTSLEELRLQNAQILAIHQKAETQEKYYQELFEFAPDPYFVTNLEGEVLLANNATVQLLQIPLESLIGQSLVNFIPAQERHTFLTQLQQLQDAEQIQHWELEWQTHRGYTFHGAVSVFAVFDRKNNPHSLRWQLRDITARKQAEEKVRFYELQDLQLQEAIKIKAQFLALVSHELRTPMNTILGFSQLLLRRYYHLFPPELKNMIERIVSSGKHLMRLIEDILDFSKLQAGNLELRWVEVNIVKLVTTTVQDLSFLARQKNLSIAVHTDVQNPIIINDGDRLKQVLVKLISNAIKFTETGGVFVEVQQLNQNRVKLMVKDTGIGIPEAELDHIFQEFWQLDQSTTRKYHGIGLGLAIVNKLVDLMHGSITVESKLNQGSTFCVELPRKPN